jgi:hypothetical protein
MLWDSRDVKTNYLHNKVKNYGDEQSHLELINELKSRMESDSLFKELFPEH